MILGTASHVGKSLVATAFCRLLAEAGFRVAPFKAQNMALNSFVTREGGEIGRAQVAQAEAAGVEPHVDMNPILLKPMGGVSQVVLEGSPWRTLGARDYYAARDHLWPRVAAAYDRLAARFDRIVLEGAGSPVEVNLADCDLTNLRMARHADAAIVLVADIERGGVFAQVVGTWELLGAADRARVVGIIINKFRGDLELLAPGLAFLRERTGVPVLGVLPYRADLQIDQEDSLGIDATSTPSVDGPGASEIEVAVARLPGLSNFTDFWPLARMPGVRLSYVESGAALGRPDLVILPGTRTTARDLEWLRASGLAERIEHLARDENGPVVIGICGGFQMLGTRIDDPLGVESPWPSVSGLGLLDVITRFEATKERQLVSGQVLEDGLPFSGYELHMAQTERALGVAAWSMITRQRDGATEPDGARASGGRVIGTYVHGLFDSLPLCIGLVERLRARRGLPPLDPDRWRAHRAAIGRRYEDLAALLRLHLDLEPVWKAVGWNPRNALPSSPEVPPDRSQRLDKTE
jgi:adenosylcobyric acid synthase